MKPEGRDLILSTFPENDLSGIKSWFLGRHEKTGRKTMKKRKKGKTERERERM